MVLLLTLSSILWGDPWSAVTHQRRWGQLEVICGPLPFWWVQDDLHNSTIWRLHNFWVVLQGMFKVCSCAAQTGSGSAISLVHM